MLPSGLESMGPMQLANHVAQNGHAGGHKPQWDKTNKGHKRLKLCLHFVVLVPVRLLLSSNAVLYHVNN